MSWIRSNLTVVVIVIAVAILAFIVQDGCNNRSGFGNQGPTSVGSVAGQEISRREFAELYDRMLQNTRQRTGVITDQDRQNAMATTWSQLVRNKMYEKELDAIGIDITPQELADLFTGDPVHPQVAQYFQAYFEQEGKPMNGASVAEYLDQLENSGNQELIQGFKEFETAIKRYRAQEKLDNIFRAAYLGSTAEARREYVAQNRKVDISFLAVPYSSVPDSQFTLTDADFQAYIKENDHDFKQDASTSIRFVKFEITPSAQDTAATKNRVERFRKAYAETDNDSMFVLGKSRSLFRNEAQAPSAVPPTVIDSFLAGNNGDLFGPIREGGFFKMYKLIKVENSDESYAEARSILVPYGADSAEARQKARDIKNRANASNFADLMAENNGSEARWYSEAGIEEDIYDALSSASAGSIIGPFESRGGYVILHVTDKTNKQFLFSEIEEEIGAGDRTADQVYKNATNFAAKVQENGSLEAIAAQDGLNSFSSGQLYKNTFNLTGVTEGARRIILWALEAPLNSVSEIEEAGDAYIVAQVTEKREEGLQSVEDVRNSIRTQVMNEKKADYIMGKLKGLSGGLQEMADAYGENATVKTATGVNFASPTIAGMGNEPYIVGLVCGMQKDQVSELIEGETGVYKVQVTNITDAVEPDPSTLATQKEAKVATGSNSFQTKAAQAMQELADVEDNRAKAGY